MDLSELLVSRINENMRILMHLQEAEVVEIKYGYMLKKETNRYYLELRGENLYLRVYDSLPSVSPKKTLEKAAAEIRAIALKGRKNKNKPLNIHLEQN